MTATTNKNSQLYGRNSRRISTVIGAHSAYNVSTTKLEKRNPNWNFRCSLSDGNKKHFFYNHLCHMRDSRRPLNMNNTVCLLAVESFTNIIMQAIILATIRLSIWTRTCNATVFTFDLSHCHLLLTLSGSRYAWVRVFARENWSLYTCALVLR